MINGMWSPEKRTRVLMDKDYSLNREDYKELQPMTSTQIYRLDNKYSKAILKNMQERLLETEITNIPL